MNQSPPVVPSGACAGRTYLFVALATVLAATRGHGFAEFGGGILNFNAIAQITSDSNVFGDTSDESDVFYTLRPQLNYDREGSRGTTHLDGGVAINRYSDFSDLDSDDWFLNGALQLPPGIGRLSGGATLTYFDGSESDDFIGQRIDMERLNLGINSSYELSGRTSVRLGGALTRYETSLRPESDSYTVRAGLALKLRPTIDGFIDVAQSSTKTDETALPPFNVDYRSTSVTTGVDGQLTATITGAVSVGYEKISSRVGDVGGDGNNFVARVSLTWAARQNTQVTLTGGSETRITANAQSIDAVNASVTIQQRLGAALTATGSVLWETFKTRGLATPSDDRLVAQLNLEYQIHDRLAFGGGIHHNERYSFNPVFDISRTTLNVFGRVTF